MTSVITPRQWNEAPPEPAHDTRATGGANDIDMATYVPPRATLGPDKGRIDGDPFFWQRDSATTEGAVHNLLMPPHPGNVYESSALCSCGEWQYDSGSPTSLSRAYADVLRDYTVHRRALLADVPDETRKHEPRCVLCGGDWPCAAVRFSDASGTGAGESQS